MNLLIFQNHMQFYPTQLTSYSFPLYEILIFSQRTIL